MKYKTIFALLLIYSNFSLIAQHQKKFDYILPRNGSFESVIFFQGDILGAGNYNFGTGSKGMIHQIDTSGAVIWKDSLLQNISIGLSLLPHTDSSWYLGGQFEASNGVNDLFCRQYDTSNHLNWEKSYDSPGSFNADDFSDMATDQNGNLYIGGSGRPAPPANKAHILKYDSAGNLMANNMLTLASSNNVIGIEVSGQQVAASVFQFGNPAKLLLYSFNLSLQQQWAKTSSLFPYQMFTTLASNPSGYLAMGGSFFPGSKPAVEVYRPNGDTSALFFPTSSISGFGKVIQVIMDSSRFIYSLSNFNQYFLLSKHDTSGNHYWSDTLSNSNLTRNVNEKLMHLQGDRLYLATSYLNTSLYEYDTSGTRLGRTTFSINVATNNIYFSSINADDNGNVVLGGQARFSGNIYQPFIAYFTPQPISTALIDATRSPELKVYPTPTNGVLYFSKSLKTYRLYNLQGLLLKEGNGILNELNIADFPSGVYLLKGETQDQESFRIKVVKN